MGLPANIVGVDTFDISNISLNIDRIDVNKPISKSLFIATFLVEQDRPRNPRLPIPMSWISALPDDYCLDRLLPEPHVKNRHVVVKATSE